jgi:OmcA/MtrC family decaheme c-type cytochrome
MFVAPSERQSCTPPKVGPMSSYRGFFRRRLIAVFAGLLVGVLGIILAACGTGPTGPQGNPGANALVSTSQEQPGANCPNGGTKIETGLDANGNGVLDPSEVNAQATTYVCNGSGTSGQASLVSTTPEPSGTNCQFGGVRVDSGVDKNNDGKLDTSEITNTTYMCNTAPSGTLSVTKGIAINVKSGGVSTNTTGPVTVRFTLKDSNGYPVDIKGVYSINQAIQPRFALAYYTKDSNGNVSPLKVLTQSTSAAADGGTTAPQPTMYNPLGTAAGQGTITENGMGAGDYTYSFPTTATSPGAVAVQYDPAKLSENHVVWILSSRQTDMVYPTNGKTFYTDNFPYYFIPAGGTATPRQIVANANCQKCHDNFRLEVNTSDEFVQHGGQRINGELCNVCHNPDRYSNPSADSKVFIHRIHNGEHIQPANLFHGISATFPQDVRNCDVCHKNALQGQQDLLNPSRAACGSCHDYVDFTGQNGLPTCGANGVAIGDAGLPIPCGHVGGAQSDDTQCTLCHKTTTHLHYAKDTPAAWPVAPPDPNNSKLVDGGNNNTNAGYLAQGGWVPPGAAQINYVLKSVQTWSDTSNDAGPAVTRPSITFKLQMTAYGSDAGASDIVFNSPSDAGTVELMPNFVGSPSVYFAWAVPQDGIAAPADFNASGSVWIKDALNAKAKTGVLTGPDTSGYYTIQATNIVIPTGSTMLTGGVGYTYALSTTQPLTETDLTQFPYTAATSQGGLVMTAPDVSMVAKGFTARRAIIDNNQCKDCHGILGVTPTFHAGQRNDGATCSFCHNPNRTSSGWSASSKYYIHAIHGGRNRKVDFTWHSTNPTSGFWDVEFPSPLNDCKVCHAPNTYDFTATASLAAVPNMPLTAVGTGKYDSNPLTNPTGFFSISPYVDGTNTTDYGAGFSANASTGAVTQGAGTNLVISQITTACSACHDAPTDIAHMKANGGTFYDTRQNAMSGPGEQCLICHGPGRVAAVGEVHLQ